MVYLLKVTVIWALFLLLFEMLYKSNGRFTANRFYLLLSMAGGLLLPLVSLPSTVGTVPPAVFAATPVLHTIDAFSSPATGVANMQTMPAAPVVQETNGWQILQLIYIAGMAFLFLKVLWESVLMWRLIVRNPQQCIAGKMVVVTGKPHAPYSFMGRIFMGQPASYQPAELQYIVLHEAAHNRKKHWLDLLLLQLVCIGLWFHPLVWRLRYLLQLQHEFEADHLAARNDNYSYGHFLLRQTLLNGVPTIAHSFHFSPIKNRIKMLTRRQQSRSGSWKYLLILPALIGCTLLMAKTGTYEVRARRGNITTYNGNTFRWRDAKLLIDVPPQAENKAASKGNAKNYQVIYEVNGEPVYQNEQLKTPSVFEHQANDYYDYLVKEFSALRKNLPDSLSVVIVSNVVVNKQGKVVYYDLHSLRPFGRYGKKDWHPYGNQEPSLNKLMDKIITNTHNWKPAMIDGKPVNTVISFGWGC